MLPFLAALIELVRLIPHLVALKMTLVQLHLMCDTEPGFRSLFPFILNTLILSVYFEQANGLDEVTEFCVTVIA